MKQAKSQQSFWLISNLFYFPFSTFFYFSYFLIFRKISVNYDRFPYFQISFQSYKNTETALQGKQEKAINELQKLRKNVTQTAETVTKEINNTIENIERDMYQIFHLDNTLREFVKTQFNKLANSPERDTFSKEIQEQTSRIINLEKELETRTIEKLEKIQEIDEIMDDKNKLEKTLSSEKNQLESKIKSLEEQLAYYKRRNLQRALATHKKEEVIENLKQELKDCKNTLFETMTSIKANTELIEKQNEEIQEHLKLAASQNEKIQQYLKVIEELQSQTETIPVEKSFSLIKFIPSWYAFRKGRITPSVMKEGCRTNLKNPSISLIKKIR